jgi:endogenous inhibitor of DNA gyrase (YacG/DUF329 family)
MNDLQKQRIKQLRQQGVGYSKIAEALGLKTASVKSYCQRNELGGIKTIPALNSGQAFCRNCGTELTQTPGRKPRRFCSDGCRVAWWKANPPRTEKATYHFTCLNCGEQFEVYGNANRKFCTHGCYVAARFGKQVAA